MNDTGKHDFTGWRNTHLDKPMPSCSEGLAGMGVERDGDRVLHGGSCNGGTVDGDSGERNHSCDNTVGGKGMEEELAALDIELDKVYFDCNEIFMERHRRYGSKNINRYGERGVVVRLGDKLARLETRYLEGGEVADPENDWMDIVNYAMIGLLLERNRWPK